MSKLKYKDSNGVWQPIAPSQKEFDDFKDTTVEQLAERATSVKTPPPPLVAAKGDGVTDDTTTIQGVIDYLWNNGGGIALVPNGTFRASAVYMRDRVTLLGLSWYSILKSIDNNTNVGIIQMYNKQTIWAKVINLAVDGNKANQTQAVDGVREDSTNANNDTHNIFENLYIHDCKGHGYSMPAQSRENRIINVWSEKNEGDGFNIHGTDNFMGFCTSNNNGGNGFNLDAAYSNKLTTCKAFANTLDGFIFQNLTNVQIENLESQENAKNGYTFKNASYVTGSTILSDTNSTGSNKLDVAFNLDNSHHIQVKGIASNSYNLQGNGQGYAVRLANNSYNNDISLVKYGNQKPMNNVDDQSKDVTNKIEINNALFSIRDLQRKYLVDDSNNDGLSDVFDSIYVHPTAITGSKKINFTEQSQELSIDSSTSSGDWAIISADKTIPIVAGQSLSLEVIAKLTDNVNTYARVKIEWLDASSAVLSTDGVYGDSVFLLNKVAPVNAINARVRTTLYPKNTGGTGKMYIKSFKYGIYQ